MMRTSKAGVCNNAGFTLVELAMVILVIGIVGAIALPRIGGTLDRQQMRQTINMVRGTVRYLHARSALTKRVYRLTFDLDRQSMSICYITVENCQAEHARELRAYRLPDAVRILDVVDAQGNKAVEGEVTVHFHPTGLVEPRTMHLRGPGTQQMTLMIEPLAGRVKVLDGHVDPEDG